MTFSICVYESSEDEDGAQQGRFGVGATTRLPAVGRLCAFVSENGAVAAQSVVPRMSTMATRTARYPNG